MNINNTTSNFFYTTTQSYQYQGSTLQQYKGTSLYRHCMEYLKQEIPEYIDMDANEVADEGVRTALEEIMGHYLYTFYLSAEDWRSIRTALDKAVHYLKRSLSMCLFW